MGLRLVELTGARSRWEIGQFLLLRSPNSLPGEPDAVSWMRALMERFRVRPRWLVFGVEPRLVDEVFDLNKTAVDMTRAFSH